MGTPVDLPFRLELYQKSYVFKSPGHTAHLLSFGVIIQVGPPIWLARSQMRFDRCVRGRLIKQENRKCYFTTARTTQYPNMVKLEQNPNYSVPYAVVI